MTTIDKLARRTHQVEWSGIRIMFAMAEQIPDVVNLGIGQPDFDTPAFIREAAKKALDDGFTRYPPAKGFADLRKAIAKKLAVENGITADPHTEIFVAVGAMQVIFNTCLHLLNPGDEVIVIDPGYDYYSQIRLFGGVPVPVKVYESNQFKVDPADIEAAITEKTKLMIINTPSNPTGALFDEEILKTIADMAQARDIWVLSDEPYEHILFDGHNHVSIGAFEGMAERTISAFTLSKSYAMTGWRVGYACRPQGDRRRDGKIDGAYGFRCGGHGPAGCLGRHHSSPGLCAGYGGHLRPAATARLRWTQRHRRHPLPQAGIDLLRFPEHQGQRALLLGVCQIPGARTPGGGCAGKHFR